MCAGPKHRLAKGKGEVKVSGGGGGGGVDRYTDQSTREAACRHWKWNTLKGSAKARFT